MATIQQSIELRVPVQAAYSQLTQFEEYPRFMEAVESVQQIDDTHLHWTTNSANRPVEWDAEITEQEPDRCIAWHNTSGALNTGKVELQSLGPDTSQVTFTLRTEPEQLPGAMTGESEQEMALRLKQDLARLKDFIEAHGSEAGGWRGEVHDGDVTVRDRDAGQGSSSVTPATPAKPGDYANPSAGSAPTGTVVGAAGGTDAAAGAQLSGSKGGPGGPGLRQGTDASGVPGTPGGVIQDDAAKPVPGAGAVGGTGLGSTASADDTRTGTGTTSGSSTALSGSGTGAGAAPGGSGATGPGISSGKGKTP